VPERHATASGPVSQRRAWELYKEVCDTAVAQRYSKVLMDGVAVTGDLSLRERHALGRKAAEYERRHRMSLKIALLGQATTMNRVAVAVAQNRGLNIEAFSDRQRALDWLQGHLTFSLRSPCLIRPYSEHKHATEYLRFGELGARIRRLSARSLDAAFERRLCGRRRIPAG